ncbi:hypothetical protein FCL47_18750 [Desulfopila sp. IMCC35006]|uniref:hypothetical protein n=1 Tax=Desulfopila sp. IMCC35006 TaxID=2569542 RepID=UPI0010ACF9C1|nr:hypothetical protein [Desulfopila sp. IMCC35006]TKB24227.1 hypothetical protein FCL47_18750 [Desulfopila sp. IMCC35006]
MVKKKFHAENCDQIASDQSHDSNEQDKALALGSAKKLNRELYLDLVNQVLLMSLFARELYFSDKKVRKVFEKIHKAHEVLSDRTKLKEMFNLPEDGASSWLRRYLTDEQSDLFMEFTKEDEETFGNTLEDIYRLNQHPQRARYELLNEKPFNETPFLILIDILLYFDREIGISNDRGKITSQYQDFLRTLTGNIVPAGQLRGYSHLNLFICLYYPDILFSKLISEANLVKDRGGQLDELQPLELKEQAKLLWKTVESLPLSSLRSRSVDKPTITHDDEYSPSVKFEVDLSCNRYIRAMKLSKKNGKNPELYSFLEYTIALFQEKLMGEYKMQRELPPSEEKLLADDYQSYKNNPRRKSEEKIVHYAKTVSTVFQAILTWDYLHGPRKDATKLSVMDAMKLSATALNIKEKLKYPGVKRIYNEKILAKIKNKDYSQLQKELYQTYSIVESRLTGEYFPFPLFFK